jgi:hypothetical protein
VRSLEDDIYKLLWGNPGSQLSTGKRLPFGACDPMVTIHLAQDQSQFLEHTEIRKLKLGSVA